MSNKATNLIAAGLLIFVFLICIFSIKNEALTMDEQAHLPAGYSYLTQQDMRLNPEHPPLLKDLAAVPLLFINNINFPTDSNYWNNEVNGQWEFGKDLLFRYDNPAQTMIFWGRIPMILILLLLGFYVFKWTKELFGNKAGLLAITLFSFSPTLLAHGRLVTTDVGAAFGIVFATYYFIKALNHPSKKNIIIAGLAFGLAELLKFSVILLIPFFSLLGLVWWLIKANTFLKTVKIGISVLLLGFVLIWPVYQFHTLNYPPQKQVADTQVYLNNTPDIIKQPILWASDKPILRPYALYATGLTMVFHRVAGGNDTYFLGKVSNVGWKSYFPITYLIKVPLAFQILTLIALIWALWHLRRKESCKEWLKKHFAVFAMFVFLAVYWTTSIKGNLNIGIRHLMPVFPLTIILVSAGINSWLKQPHLKAKHIIVAALLLWQIIAVLVAYPHFIAYFNEAVGGSANGYKYVVDSNLDWGQDLRRLSDWVDKNNIETIYVDYFGGSLPEYILQEKFARWWGDRDPNELPKGSYLAISASFLQGGRGEPSSTYVHSSGFYKWLDAYEPITVIGNSIFVYQID